MPTERTITQKPGEDIIIKAPKGYQQTGTITTDAFKTRTRIPAPTTTATPPPPPPVEPPPPPSGATNLFGVDFTARPRSGPEFERMKAAAKGLRALSMNSVDGNGGANGSLLAAAYLAAATGDADLKGAVVKVIADAMAPTAKRGRTLEQARNLAPFALALGALDEHALDAMLKAERDRVMPSQGSVRDCQRKRPNNWGTCSGLARVAVDAHIGDLDDLADAAKVFLGWVGDRSAYTGFTYGSLDWQANPTQPVGINWAGAKRGSVLVDGILPDDQRRQSEHGSKPRFPVYACENYVWQAAGEVFMTALILRANGYPDVFTWADHALQRMYVSLAAHDCEASGDDAWQYANAQMVGVTISHDGYAPGKSAGWTDWLY